MKLFQHNCYSFIYGIAVVLVIFPAHASNQVIIAPPPEGTLSITVTKADTAQITGLSDVSIPLGTATRSSTTLVSSACVYSSLRSTNYTITAIGSPSADGAFVVANGESLLPYNVAWITGMPSSSSSEGMSLAPNIPSNAISKTKTSNYSCSGTSNGEMASLIINIPQATLQAANAGSYADILTLVMSPN